MRYGHQKGQRWPQKVALTVTLWSSGYVMPELEAKLLLCTFLSSQYITHLAKQQRAADESG